MEPGIIPALDGGLGNQMFMVAAAYVVCEINKCPMYLGTPEGIRNPHNRKGYDYRDTLFKRFGSKIDVSQTKLEESTGYKTFSVGGFQKWNPCLVEPNTIMKSYFQYYPALAPYEEELRSKILKGLEGFLQEFKEREEELAQCGFVHIRRGDYLNHPDYHYLQGIEYYREAEAAVLSAGSCKKIYIITNDLEWVCSQPFFMENPLYEVYDSDDELETLAFMSLCKGGAICANSTFSWWGAFLGAHFAKNPVVVPKMWINDTIDCLFPASWQVV
jgi:hypothetical protein